MLASQYCQQRLNFYTQGIPCVIVTLLDVIGSAPQVVGARLFVSDQGLHSGTIGGGKLEAHSLRVAQDMLANPQGPQQRFVEWNLQRDIGMTCGGVVRLFFECQRPALWPIVIFGAGHVAQALISLLINLDCQISCYDPREEWIARLPQSDRLHAEVLAEPASQVPFLPEHSFLVSLTMGHAHDLPILSAALSQLAQNPHALDFVGVMGSQAKAGIIRRDLSQLGHAPALIEQIRCPLGLPVGNNTPPEIAISIVAQLLQARDQSLQHHEKWKSREQKSAYRKP